MAFDENYQIRDLFFPHVGGENHAQGYPFRFGIWVDGELSWLGPGWEISLDYQDDTLVSQVRAVHHRLGIELECQGAVDFHENLYLRRVQVRNLADRPRRALLFFHHDFNVGQSDLGNTALFDPRLEAIIHYRGPRYFLVNVLSGGRAGITEYATGVKRANGREGTWRDAEDGRLERNPMAQGPRIPPSAFPSTWSPSGGRSSTTGSRRAPPTGRCGSSTRWWSSATLSPSSTARRPTGGFGFAPGPWSWAICRPPWPAYRFS